MSIANDDDLEFMFESLDVSGIKTRVELYIEKIPIDLCESSVEMVYRSKAGASFENTSGSNSSKSVQGWSGYLFKWKFK